MSWASSTIPASFLWQSLKYPTYRVEIGSDRFAKLPPNYLQGTIYQNNNNLTQTNMSNVTEKFALAFKKEPERSFRKAGITNGDDILTPDESKANFVDLVVKSKCREILDRSC